MDTLGTLARKKPHDRTIHAAIKPSAEAAWDKFSKGYRPTRSLAASLDPERRAALREDFIAFHAGFSTELGICVPREYWLTAGEGV